MSTKWPQSGKSFPGGLCGRDGSVAVTELLLSDVWGDEPSAHFPHIDYIKHSITSRRAENNFL